ncbi:MAG: bifunctional pyr operon transcriptional regulator/uracil phosphoribosyltransferase PyrR [Flavobacteriales bacterium]|nr:bifunctional pyr operon transcriptional regulator/uracil phosphoribosyltransferase PyrR [Flavobacteriales bacterium]
MKPVTLLASKAFGLTVARLCHQLIEDHGDLEGVALIGLQPRGVVLARRIREELKRIIGKEFLAYGELDITFHRDDFRHRSTPPTPSITELDFDLNDRKVVLVDDVLFTGRSIRAGLDALLAFGRPSGVQLLVLIDRRFSRELPIQPDYVGKWVDSIGDQRVTVEWKESDGQDRVLLHSVEEDARSAASNATGTSAAS